MSSQPYTRLAEEADRESVRSAPPGYLSPDDNEHDQLVDAFDNDSDDETDDRRLDTSSSVIFDADSSYETSREYEDYETGVVVSRNVSGGLAKPSEPRRTGRFLSSLWRSNSESSSTGNNDGVFANLTAKPETDAARSREEEPPTYEEAALDATPPYWETTVMAPGGSDELFIEGLPVGSPINFAWNMIVSSAFQFVGFFLTYLLHTSHAAKHGSRAGLGITLLQCGFYLQPEHRHGSGHGSSHDSSGEFEPSNPNDFDVSSQTGVAGTFSQDHMVPVTGSTESIAALASSAHSAEAASWISTLLIVVGGLMIFKAVIDYVQVRRMELAILRSVEPTQTDESEAEAVADAFPGAARAEVEV